MKNSVAGTLFFVFLICFQSYLINSRIILNADSTNLFRRIADYNRSLEEDIHTLTAPFLNTLDNVTDWVKKEELIYNSLKLNQQRLKQEILWMKMYIKEYESSAGSLAQQFKQRKDADFIASNGIASYLMTYRYVRTLQRLKELLAMNYINNPINDIFDNHLTAKHSANKNTDNSETTAVHVLKYWPNVLDLELSKNALIHIQEVYNYGYKQLPFELSPETKRPPQLNAFHCSQLGVYALYRKHYAVSIEFIEHALELINDEYDTSIPTPVVEAHLELAAEMHNKGHEDSNTYFSAIHVKNLFLAPVEAFEPSSLHKERISTRLPKIIKSGRDSLVSAEANYNDICSGKDLRTIQERSSLYCWLDKTSSPARNIQPYKKELLSAEPEVIQVYDFLGEKMTAAFSKDKTNCSWIAHAYGVRKLSDVLRGRTASNCWVENIPELDIFWKKVSSLTLTDLRAKGSHGPFQVTEYLYGRFHSVHMDALQLSKDDTHLHQKLSANGDRLISLLLYFNDVPSGGSTPFPSAGTAAVPVKGSVVIWRNLYANGSMRYDVWHAACPVIYGHKKIGMALLHYNAQFRTHPCSLDQHE